MPKALVIALLAVIFVCAAPGGAYADTQFGIQVIALAGTHHESKEDVSGTGLAGFLRIDERWHGFALHVEGIPSVGTALVNTNTGPVRATLGMFDATARFQIDRSGRFWFGAGSQVLAQRTPQTGVSITDASRLAGSRFELLGIFPAGPSHFIELQCAAMPHLSGVLFETKSAPSYARYSISRPETAGMTDLSFAYGIRRGHSDYLAGARAINFAAKFADGREADRNVGAGLFAEMRIHI